MTHPFMTYTSAGERVSLLNPASLEQDDLDDEQIFHTLPLSPVVSTSSSEPQSSAPAGSTPRRHTCYTCHMTFTTSGHMTRHAKVHTGEKRFSCPFPGCKKRCSRNDNLLQHYRMHLPKADRKCSSACVRAEVARRRESIEASDIPSHPSSLCSSPSHSVSVSPLPPSHVSPLSSSILTHRTHLRVDASTEPLDPSYSAATGRTFFTSTSRLSFTYPSSYPQPVSHSVQQQRPDPLYSPATSSSFSPSSSPLSPTYPSSGSLLAVSYSAQQQSPCGDESTPLRGFQVSYVRGDQGKSAER